MDDMDERYYIIKILEDIKEKFQNKTYEKAEDLKYAFYNTIFLLWKDLDDLNRDNLSDLFILHKFLIDEVVSIHESENSRINEEIMKKNINIRSVSDTLEDSKRAFNIGFFKDENSEYFLVGDIHSDCYSVQSILEKTDFFARAYKGEDIKIIFIGDYVDRGKSHFKLLQHILTLKYLFPENIFLQKGNHDTGKLIDGKIKMGVRKSAKSLEKDWFLLYLYNLVNKNPSLPFEIINSYLKFFDSLSVLSFIVHKEKILMVAHAGIPRYRGKEDFYSYINSISDLTNEEVKDHLGKTIVNNIIWSDPTTAEKDLKENKGRFKFTQEHFDEFRKLIGFDTFVRGHEVETRGYKSIFDENFITIFSSGVIIREGKNVNRDTSYTNVRPHIVNFTKDGEIIFIDLNE